MRMTLIETALAICPSLPRHAAKIIRKRLLHSLLSLDNDDMIEVEDDEETGGFRFQSPDGIKRKFWVKHEPGRVCYSSGHGARSWMKKSTTSQTQRNDNSLMGGRSQREPTKAGKCREPLSKGTSMTGSNHPIKKISHNGNSTIRLVVHIFLTIQIRRDR